MIRLGAKYLYQSTIKLTAKYSHKLIIKLGVKYPHKSAFDPHKSAFHEISDFMTSYPQFFQLNHI